MKENYTQLYPNEQVAQKVGDYCIEHSTKLPKHITDHHAWGTETQERANYMISPLQAQFQIWMARAVGAKRILEIGTFIGFSTMAFSHAVGPTGHVTALGYSPEYASIAHETFKKNHISNIELIVGDARETIRKLAETLKEPYDLIFIDADKTSYPTYLSLILSLSTPSPSSPTRLLKPGGIIIGDNALSKGLAADSSSQNSATEMHAKGEGADEFLNALREFNDRMVGEERLEVFLIPMFDGLGMGRLVD